MVQIVDLPLATEIETGDFIPLYQNGILKKVTNAQLTKGAKGDQGEPGLQGPASLEWQGVYSGGVAYKLNDVVEHNGSSFVCLQDTLDNTPDVGGTEYWDILALKGTDGSSTGDLLAVNNLSDLESVSTARDNLELGDVALIDTTDETDKFLRADGTWESVPGGSSFSVDILQSGFQTLTNYSENTKYISDGKLLNYSNLVSDHDFNIISITNDGIITEGDIDTLTSVSTSGEFTEIFVLSTTYGLVYHYDTANSAIKVTGLSLDTSTNSVTVENTITISSVPYICSLCRVSDTSAILVYQTSDNSTVYGTLITVSAGSISNESPVILGQEAGKDFKAPLVVIKKDDTNFFVVFQYSDAGNSGDISISPFSLSGSTIVPSATINTLFSTFTSSVYFYEEPFINVFKLDSSLDFSYEFKYNFDNVFIPYLGLKVPGTAFISGIGNINLETSPLVKLGDSVYLTPVESLHPVLRKFDTSNYTVNYTNLTKYFSLPTEEFIPSNICKIFDDIILYNFYSVDDDASKVLVIKLTGV